MTQVQLTVDTDQLQQLFTQDGQMTHLIEQVVNQILQAQVAEHLRAQPHERTDQRQGYRNGFKPRQLTTRVGTLHLQIPQVRDGTFSTELFARYQRSEQALVLTLMEMVINGVSTRKVAAITSELCGKEFSKSTVSGLCKGLDPLIQAWNERSLHRQRIPFLIVDALVIKVREQGQVRAVSACGVNEQGYREILGLQLGDSESEASWGQFFAWLKDRGLQGVDLVVSDDHRGLVSAIGRQFQGATWQRCQTHLARNLADVTPALLWEEVHEQVRAILTAPDEATARERLAIFSQVYQERAPKAVALLEAGFDDATAVLALPKAYRKRLRTTNGQERLNEEVRQRERVIRIFPNRESAVRLLGALLLEQDEQWTTGRKYFEMTEYWAWKEGHSQPNTPPRQTA